MLAESGRVLRRPGAGRPGPPLNYSICVLRARADSFRASSITPPSRPLSAARFAAFFIPSVLSAPRTRAALEIIPPAPPPPLTRRRPPLPSPPRTSSAELSNLRVGNVFLKLRPPFTKLCTCGTLQPPEGLPRRLFRAAGRQTRGVTPISPHPTHHARVFRCVPPSRAALARPTPPSAPPFPAVLGPPPPSPQPTAGRL
ncbi:formin-like protein 5 [Schistocerca americana]|uniref:formin-like protein 5 n=1 Tax=Schistocerca americana TaxID=7009 RepID=UPI001F502D18|nr:formin-like protein 5 [Schistocerca americana]